MVAFVVHGTGAGASASAYVRWKEMLRGMNSLE